MPILKEIQSEDNHIAIWQINESEDTLLSELGVNVELPQNHHRRLERLATLNLLKRLGYGETYSYEFDGRPYLPNSNLHLSISHAGDKVVVATNPTRPIGVDIEQTQRNYRKIAPKYMSERELLGIDAYQPDVLSLIWCVKEAVYKLPWGVSKCFNTEIEVMIDVEQLNQGWCNVRVKHDGAWICLKFFYEFIDSYCLVWVNR